MKKTKKFIDFEIVTILTILILMATFYFAIKYTEIEKDIIIQDSFEFKEYQILADFRKTVNGTGESEMFKVQVIDLENNLIYNSSTDFELIAIITVFINIIVLIIYVILVVIKMLMLSRNKRILSKESFTEEIGLPQYDISIANTLYTGRISFSKIYDFLGEYFRKNEMIDKKGKINPNLNVNNLSELEKDFIYFYQKEVSKETKEQFKNKIIKELEDRNYLKNNRLRIFMDFFRRKIDNIVEEFYNLDRFDIKRSFIEAVLPFALLLLIAVLKYFSILLIIGIAYMQLKYYTIFLTEEGKREKAKITLLVEKLKNKDELTEDEKFFYDALKYINL